MAPHLVMMLLTILTDDEVFASMEVLFRKKERQFRDIEAGSPHPITVFNTSPASLSDFGYVLDTLARINVPAWYVWALFAPALLIHRFAGNKSSWNRAPSLPMTTRPRFGGEPGHLCHLKVLFPQWVATFFAGLPLMPFRLELLLLWVSEGPAIVLRVGMGLLSCAMDSLMRENEVHTHQSFLQLLEVFLRSMTPSVWKAVKMTAFSFSKFALRERRVENIIRTRSDASSSNSEQLETPYYRPVVSTVSEVIAHDHYWELVWSYLPERFRSQHPVPSSLPLSLRDRMLTCFLLDVGVQRDPPWLLVDAVDEARAGRPRALAAGDADAGPCGVRGHPHQAYVRMDVDPLSHRGCAATAAHRDKDVFMPDREACLFSLPLPGSDDDTGHVYRWSMGRPDHCLAWSPRYALCCGGAFVRADVLSVGCRSDATTMAASLCFSTPRWSAPRCRRARCLAILAWCPPKARAWPPRMPACTPRLCAWNSTRFDLCFVRWGACAARRHDGRAAGPRVRNPRGFNHGVFAPLPPRARGGVRLGLACVGLHGLARGPQTPG